MNLSHIVEPGMFDILFSASSVTLQTVKPEVVAR